MKIRNYINIALIIIWMSVIFNFSNQNSTESSSLSDKVIIKIAKIINKEQLTQEEQKKIISKYKIIVRKSAHFISYFILGLLIIIFLIDIKWQPKYIYLLTLFFCFIYACTDEIHQLFISGRHGSFIDVLIDTSGSLMSLIIVRLSCIIKKRIIKK